MLLSRRNTAGTCSTTTSPSLHLYKPRLNNVICDLNIGYRRDIVINRWSGWLQRWAAKTDDEMKVPSWNSWLSKGRPRGPILWRHQTAFYFSCIQIGLAFAGKSFGCKVTLVTDPQKYSLFWSCFPFRKITLSDGSLKFVDFSEKTVLQNPRNWKQNSRVHKSQLWPNNLSSSFYWFEANLLNILFSWKRVLWGNYHNIYLKSERKVILAQGHLHFPMSTKGKVPKKK